MKNKILLSGIAITFALLMGTSAAIAQQYYPLVVSTTDPTTGTQQQHTIYVPLSVANSVAGGNAVYTAEPVALSSNPWADTSISSTGAQVTGTVTTTTSSAAMQRTASAPAAAKSDPTNPRDLPLPTWTGTNTTWNVAMGQEMIAPEINKQNMLSMAQHLRRLGYIVPDTLDSAIASAPEKTRLALVEDMNKIQNSGGRDSPMLQAIGKITRDLEANYGFSFENILDNSMRILDAR